MKTFKLNSKATLDIFDNGDNFKMAVRFHTFNEDILKKNTKHAYYLTEAYLDLEPDCGNDHDNDIVIIPYKLLKGIKDVHNV